jgi:ELWxxDGT repeat protein
MAGAIGFLRGGWKLSWPARGARVAVRRRRGRALGMQQLEPRIAFAVAPTLVADLNTLPNSSFPDILPGFGATSAGLVFLADDLTHGSELWISDGTSGGTRLLRDVNPGPLGISVYPTSPLFNGSYYGIVSRQTDWWDSAENELWKTDGTEAGTVMVKPVPGTYGGLSGFVSFAGKLYFPSAGKVWETDGTTAGTLPLDGFGSGNDAYADINLFVLGDKLFGFVTDANGTTLYGKTFTGAVQQVMALPSVDLGYVFKSAIVGGRCIFAAADGDSPIVVWSTDGTAAGTGPIAAGAGPTDPSGFTTFGSAVYFSAQTAAHGTEMWRTDGTASGTTLVKDIEPGADGSYPDTFTVAAGKLFFRAETSAAGGELWVSDGSTAGTKLVKDITTGSNGDIPLSADPTSLTPFAGKLFFTANGHQLWKSDGTTAGTVLVKDPMPNAPTSGSGGFGALAEFNGRLFFGADNDEMGTELWASDGTEAGTNLVKDIAPGDGDGVPGGSASYVAGAALGGLFLFAGDDGMTGQELWKRDAAGAVSLVKDIADDSNWGDNTPSRPEEFVAIGNAVYFSATNDPYGPVRQVWKTDGTTAGTVRVGTVASTSNAAFGFTAFGDAVIFCADTATGRGIYRTNGTNAGTVLVADGFDADRFTLCNGKLYFTSYKDGASTVYVMASPSSTPVRAAFDDGTLFTSPGWLAAVGTRLYFTANPTEGGQDPWIARLFVTDGTAAGTKGVATGQGVFPQIYGYPNLTAATGTLYFKASTPETGDELWRTQTVAGVETAVLVKDIVAGSDDSTISSLVADGAKLFFLKHGTFATPAAPVLWESDGTPAGTKPTTIIGGQQPSILALSTPSSGKLFAAARDQTNGTELWALNIVTPPGVPTGLTGTPGAASVALSWVAPASNGGLPINDYVVQYRRASVATWSTLADGVSAATNASVTGLVAGANYMFRVIARNDAGDGLPSTSIAATVLTPPGAPTGLKAAGGAGQAVLNWTAPASAGSRPITDYVVEFRRASVAAWSVFADGVSTATTATVTGLVGGANYVFRVSARSTAGDGVPSTTAVATILTPPSPPQWISAVAGQGSATLAWTLPSSQGSSPITDYVIEYRRLSSAVWSTFNDGVSTTRSATVTGLVRGANYAFRIVARSAAGDSLPSGQRSLTIG